MAVSYLKPERGQGVAVLAGALRPGAVYRREQLATVTTAVDRHLRELVSDGVLVKLAQGLYYAPQQSAFGMLPPDEHVLLAAFLRDKDFLIFSPSDYNVLGVGTTQLYSQTLVYNRKRHGIFTLGNRRFDCRVKHRFPKKLTAEFLFIDMLNNLDQLAEDKQHLLEQAQTRAPHFERRSLQRALSLYGSVATRKLLTGWLNDGVST